MVVDPDPYAMRERVLTALAGNRAPGFHFPGYFLEIFWPRIGERNIVPAMLEAVSNHAARHG